MHLYSFFIHFMQRIPYKFSPCINDVPVGLYFRIPEISFCPSSKLLLHPGIKKRTPEDSFSVLYKQLKNF